MMTKGMYYNRKGEEISMEEWASLFEDFQYRIVAQTECEGIKVSTVWLGLNHNFGGGGAPLIFETMIFFEGMPELDEWQKRYATEQEAEESHKAAIKMVNDALNSKG